MKKIRIVIFALLVVAIGALVFKMNEYQDIISEKEAKIETIQDHLLSAELELEDKNKYIEKLNESVEDLKANVTTLEEKLNELSIAKDKLK